MSAHLPTLLFHRYSRVLIGLTGLFAALPVFAGSFIFALAFYVGFPTSIAALSNSSAWLQVTAVLVVHFWLAGTCAFLAIAMLRGAAISTLFWGASAASLVAGCILAVPSKPGDTFFIGYSWPAMLATTVLLGLSRSAVLRGKSAQTE